MNKTTTLEKIFRLFLKVFYYYYFVLALINLVCFYFEFHNIMNVTTILMLIGLAFDLFHGYRRGCLGIFGYIVSIGLSIYFIHDIWLGISVGISVISIINIFINKIIGKFLSFMINKFN